ncbi:dihydrodipicolinate synthase family protein [Solirubrobacter deserti]|uniref:Dihydrodipicolinate synthase family protein n=1 Tax=Solirubrobacter deserti TaxID=2282478 RepID=A0ABT4RGQ0_9ACTN|nr:dihydrodipicolinate synthase family protein [Solirubrobacter deserti]MDA0137719.1 dihydrodipicolinate synthase family protein [Solirubrobacter deserti]
MKGVFAAVLTPMREDLSVDRAAFAAHCRRLLDDGCHGLGIFGTTGEANSLSVRERVDACEGLVEDGIPADVLLPGTGACALPDAVTLAREALAVGAPGVLALPPFYYKGVSDDGLLRFFAELIERVGDDRLRLFLYHIPPMAQVGFTPDLIGRLLDAYPGVVAGTKDSAGDAARIERLCKQFPQLTVFAGTERFLLDTLRWGGDGCISATCNVTAAQSRRVYDLWEAGDAAADAEQAALTETRSFLEGFPPIPALKAIMRARTGDDVWANLRPPLDALAEDRVRELTVRL